MQIIYIAPFDLTRPAGHTTHIVNTVREMSKQGHHVILLAGECPRSLASEVEAIRVPLVRRPGLNSLSFGVFAAFTLLSKLRKVQRPAAVYARQFTAVSLPTTIASMAKLPTVLEINADPRNEQRTQGRHAISAAVESAELRWVLSRTSGVIAVTEAIAQRVTSDFLDARSGPPVHVVPNGVDTAVYRPKDRAECCERTGLDADRMRIVFAGSFQTWQGLEVLIEAMRVIADERDDTDLLLVGDGPLRASIEAQIQAAGLSERCRITGFVTDERASDFIGSSDICVAPYSLDAAADNVAQRDAFDAQMRGSPLKIYCYLASGLPTVASHFHEAGAYLAREGVGLAVPPGAARPLATALLDLLGDAERRAKMGAAARRLAVQRHDWAAVVRRYVQIAIATGTTTDSTPSARRITKASS